MSRAAWLLGLLLVVVAAAAAGCRYSVDDGEWTYVWRADGRELRDRALLWNGSCRDRGAGTPLLAHLRASRLRTCTRACAAGTGEERDACALRCDGSIALVSARCEPRTHGQVWSPLPTR